MQKTIYLEPSQVPAQLKRHYTGKAFKAVITEAITIPAAAGNWSGGSRETFELVRLLDGKSMPVSDNVSAPWDARHDNRIELQPGFAVVLHSIFCGKDMGLTFYLRPDNAAELLPAPAAELTPHQHIVLRATAQYKASYNGQDRYQMAAGYNPEPSFPSRAQWDAAKAELIALGYLNKAGAITIKGRNAQ